MIQDNEKHHEVKREQTKIESWRGFPSAVTDLFAQPLCQFDNMILASFVMNVNIC
jgi:hypothetical protein